MNDKKYQVRQATVNNTPSQASYDVVIVGGAMYGASVSWFLSDNPDFDGSVLVVERNEPFNVKAVI